MSIDLPTHLTPDDLLSLPDRKSFELVAGELVPLKMSVESSWIAGRILRRLGEWGEDMGLGWAFPEGTGFQCFADDPSRVRKPDVSFIARNRLSQIPLDQGFHSIVPDLVVEVVSTHDLAWEVDAKVNDWLGAGVPTVWVVMPQSRSIIVHTNDRDAHKLTAEDNIAFELIPKFHCHVADFFPTPVPAKPKKG